MTLIILATFAGGLFALLQALTWRRAAVARQLQLVRTTAGPGGVAVAIPEPRRRRIGEGVATELARIGSRVQPGLDATTLRRRLHMSGVQMSARRFLAAKTAMSLAALAAAGAGVLTGHASMLLTGPALAVSLFVLPDAWLTMRQRSRRLAMERQLPDTLDLLTVSVEAGLGFDAAVQKVTERMRGPLLDEFALMLHEMRLGSTRRQAMQNVADRTGSDDIRTFVRSLLQSDELGVPLGTALRVQAEDLRTHRQLRAEEKATRAPVKLLFPTVVFIFPVIFLVVVAPAMMNVLDMLDVT